MNSLNKILTFALLSGVAAAAAGCADLAGKLPQHGPDYGAEEATLLQGKEDTATTPSSVVALAAGEIKRATFTTTSPIAQYRAFTFDGRQGQRVDIYVDGLSRLDTVVFLYKVSSYTRLPFGTPLKTNDDTTNPGWTLQTNTTPNSLSSNIVGFTLPETRKYAIVATTYQQRYAGSAEVTWKTPATRIQCAGLIAYPECPAGMFCDIDVANACNGADLPGYCKARPSACAEIYAPVCGCNGVTYGNDCERQIAGAQLDHTGPCGNAGDPCSSTWACQSGLTCTNGTCTAREGGVGATCGTRGALPCAAGLWCRHPVGALCGWADGGGQCTAITEQLCLAVYQPVCGCDNRTYSNQCQADNAKVSVQYNGECRRRVTLAELQQDPRAFNGQKVEVTAEPVAGVPMCTRMACSETNPCCNRCSSSFAIGGDIRLVRADGSAMGCTGNECTVSSSCSPFARASNNGPFALLGTFTWDSASGAKSLSVESFEAQGCQKSGCSSHVCANTSVITTCEYRVEYACYQQATCEVQANGLCGFTETTTLRACLDSALNGPIASTDGPRAIPDNNTTGITSTINVPNRGAVTRVSVSLNLTHTYRGDLIVKLVHPDGTAVSLSNRAGGSADNLVLADFVVSGFAGKASTGAWKLVVSDAAAYDTGTLQSWSLDVN